MGAGEVRGRNARCSFYPSPCISGPGADGLQGIAAAAAAAKSLKSDSVRPQRQQPTRLPHPWDCPGKNTGVGCHFLLQCMKVKSESEVAQSCLTPRDPMDCSLQGSSSHGIFQARVLEWGAIAFSEFLVYSRVIQLHTYIYNTFSYSFLLRFITGY